MNTSIKILLTVKDKTFELTLQEVQELQRALNLINPPMLPVPPPFKPIYNDKYFLQDKVTCGLKNAAGEIQKYSDSLTNDRIRNNYALSN